MTLTRTLAIAAVAASAFILAGCTGPTSQPLGEPKVAGEAWTETVTGSAPASGSCEVVSNDKLTLPDPTCTPGAVTTAISPADTSPVCLTANAEQPELDEQVVRSILSAYGIAEDTPDDYVIDYLVPRNLGGANDYANLWPIAINDPAHAQKGRVNLELADAVCNGRAGIQAAQFVMASDWSTALDKLNLAG